MKGDADTAYIQKSKYHAQPVEIDGIRFDSQKEARRYSELRLLERAGEIRDLQYHKAFVLIPDQRIDGRIVEHPVKYEADFCYYDREGHAIVEDTKGVKTRDYIIKRKLMLYVHNIRVKET